MPPLHDDKLPPRSRPAVEIRSRSRSKFSYFETLRNPVNVQGRGEIERSELYFLRFLSSYSFISPFRAYIPKKATVVAWNLLGYPNNRTYFSPNRSDIDRLNRERLNTLYEVAHGVTWVSTVSHLVPLT